MFRTSLFLIVSCLLISSCSTNSKTDEDEDTRPHKIPCRIEDSKNHDLFVMTLGEVNTKLAQGIFMPEKDLVTLKNGKQINNYYKDLLNIKYFKPIDKTHFPLPPSGWCSWYYYYLEISANEVKKNAKWIAENLKEYGAEYIQIDDGWQGVGHGYGDNRDWTTIDKRFSNGMDELAQYIKNLGLTPGLWLAPHGQSNRGVVDKWNTFLLMDDGTTAADTWEGTYLIDPTSDKADDYFKHLFTTLSNWGYEYFKIDGQPIVVNKYREKQEYMKNSSKDPVELYRHTVERIKETIGPERYLLGCWGIPLEGMGIMNGSRTGGDIYIDWEKGFMTALDATMQYYYLHNIAWYCDPDVMCLRSPLTLDMARAWATLQGLTGQALMSSDRLMDLSPERVEIMKQIYPAVDIRPLDLFPANAYKKIWDLKINHLGRDYDVVGCFNYNSNKKDVVNLKWKELGLPSDAKVHIFNFWDGEYLGCWEKGYFIHLDPASVKVLTLVAAKDRPQLISTNRHITQGWVDLVDFNYDEKTNTCNGVSQVIGNDTYEIRFAFPRDKNSRIKKAKAEDLETVVNNHQGWATVRFTSPKSKKVAWTVVFEPADLYSFPVRKPKNLIFEPLGLTSLKISWLPNYYLFGGYYVYYNKELLGVTPVSQVVLHNIDISEGDSIEVSAVWYDGTQSKDKISVKLSLNRIIPEELYLSDITPDTIMMHRDGIPKKDKFIINRTLQIGDKFYSKGIGTHAVSEIVYSLKKRYKIFTAEVGLDGYTLERKNGSSEFKVYGDGKLLWESDIMHYFDSARKVKIDISGIDRLRLYVGDAGDGNDYDYANWGDAKIMQ